MMVGAIPFTVSVADADMTVFTLLEALQRYRLPLSANATPVSVSVEVVAPLYMPPSDTLPHVAPPSVETCHWHAGAGLPLAVTENVVFCPAFTV